MTPLPAFCWASSRRRSSPSCSQPRPAIRNVLLISIDTLRADHVSAYGFPRPTTPHIDAVAREGVLFKNVRTPVPMTLPAHVSMLTGTLPPTHGLRDNLLSRLPEGSLTLAEMLKARGFTPAPCQQLRPRPALRHEPGLRQLRRPLPGRAQDRRPQRAERRRGDAGRDGVAGRAQGPALLPVPHFYDPHDPFEPPEPFASQVEGPSLRRGGGLRGSCVGQVAGEAPPARPATTRRSSSSPADHGEMLGEHGELNHGFFIYEGALRVPLVVRVPGAQARRRTPDRSSREPHRHRAHGPLPGGRGGSQGGPGSGPLALDRRAGRGRGSAAALRGDGDAHPLLRRQLAASASSPTAGSTSRPPAPSSTTCAAIRRRP